MPLVQNFVQESCNNPGNASTWNLAGAPSGYRSFVQAFGDSGLCFAIATDGEQSMWGIAQLTAGSPNTLTWEDVAGNSAGSTAILNFTGAVQVYCDIPAEYMVFKSRIGVLNVGDVISTGSVQVQGSLTRNYDGSAYGALITSGAVPVTAYSGPTAVSVLASARMVAIEFDAVSDERLKDNIKAIPVSDAVAFVMNVEPKTFVLKESPDRVRSGYIAQQLAQAADHRFSHMVDSHDCPGVEESATEAWRNPQDIAFSVSMNEAIPYLHMALKQALLEIEQLKAQLAAR